MLCHATVLFLSQRSTWSNIIRRVFSNRKNSSKNWYLMKLNRLVLNPFKVIYFKLPRVNKQYVQWFFFFFWSGKDDSIFKFIENISRLHKRDGCRWYCLAHIFIIRFNSISCLVQKYGQSHLTPKCQLRWNVTFYERVVKKKKNECNFIYFFFHLYQKQNCKGSTDKFCNTIPESI